MATVTADGDRFLVGTTVVVDTGPARLTVTATSEILSDDVTASHYQVGRSDALGETIVLGEEMTFLDWKGRFGWYVYSIDGEGRAAEVAFHLELDDALDHALSLAG